MNQQASRLLQPQKPSGSICRSVLQEKCVCGNAAFVGGTCDTCKKQNPSPSLSSRTGAPLPFLNTIANAFGHHDVSQIRVHTDTGAAADAWSKGAEAFTCGLDVSFARTPTLHTAAHEAAHAIQQQSNIGAAGKIEQEAHIYERHADEVADRVVSGQSSETLLDALHSGLSPGRTKALTAVHGQTQVQNQPIVQMRRIPPNIRALLIASSGGKGANFAAGAEGAQRLIDLAKAELTAAERAKVKKRRLGKAPSTLTEEQFNKLPLEQRLSRETEAIVALFPALKLGDPKLIDTGPRPATSDAANITKVVNHADTIFNSIASGSEDADIKQVFGAANVGTAKAKYAKGRTWMNKLHTKNKIVTDRSGYSDEVFQGGLTGFHEIIRVSPDVIDTPDDNDSIVTLMHESMHAGNSDVADDLYITATGFQSQPNSKKLHNSAHFEVVPWRILDPKSPNAFPVSPPTTPPTFQTFIPAGTTVGGVTAPKRTPVELGARAAYEKLNSAWALGLNLHLVYVQLYRKPTDWKKRQPVFGGIHFNNSVPFWSKVQKLTIHKKTSIDPTSPDEAKHPVSQIDVALSEGFTRRLSFGMDVLDPLHTEAQILKFEKKKATAAENAAAFPGGTHKHVNKERDFLLKLAVRDPKVGPITGKVSRDLRVVKQMNAPSDAWSDILKPRNPASFPD